MGFNCTGQVKYVKHLKALLNLKLVWKTLSLLIMVEGWSCVVIVSSVLRKKATSLQKEHTLRNIQFVWMKDRKTILTLEKCL